MQGGSSLLSMTAILACGQARKPRGKLIFSELLQNKSLNVLKTKGKEMTGQLNSQLPFVSRQATGQDPSSRRLNTVLHSVLLAFIIAYISYRLVLWFSVTKSTALGMNNMYCIYQSISQVCTYKNNPGDAICKGTNWQKSAKCKLVLRAMAYIRYIPLTQGDLGLD